MKGCALGWVAIGALVVLSGCEPPRVGNSTEAPAETWSAQPPAEWPQLVLTNEAEFEGHSALKGASAFLVKAADDRTLIATAKHLLGEAGGVEPPVSVAEFNEAIRSWKVHPRTMPQAAVEAEKIGVGGLELHGDLDWLLLSLKGKPASLPSIPLRLSERRAKMGDTVYLVGVPYSEPASKQNVYVGKVFDRMADRFTFELSPAVKLAGFSGAPIVNASGHVVGILTGSAEEEKDGKIDATGEDAATITDLLRQPLDKDAAKKEKE